MKKYYFLFLLITSLSLTAAEADEQTAKKTINLFKQLQRREINGQLCQRDFIALSEKQYPLKHGAVILLQAPIRGSGLQCTSMKIVSDGDILKARRRSKPHPKA